LTADVTNYVAGMKRAGESTKSFSQGLSQQAAGGHLDKIADRAGIMGLAIGAGVGVAVKAFMDFDKQMSSVRAATHATAGEMEQLRKAAIKAGADTQYSATEAAKGIEELAKAGVSTSDILGGGLKGALDLAAAGQMDVGAAAETAASAMTQFKLSGRDVPHVADLLAAAAGKAQGEVSDMGAALNQAGLIASGTGLSIEETTGTLAAFASAGLIGSDAGTSFKTMLQSIQAPSGKTRDLMEDLGVSAYDAAGQFVGIANFAQNLKDKLSVLTPELRANAMAQIFGSDATRAANVLYEQGAAGIQSWIEKTNDAGYAAETAAVKTDNLAGDMERLKGSLDTLLIQSGGGANGGLRLLTQSLESMVDQFGKLPSGVTATVTVMGGLTAAVLLGGAAWVKARGAIASTVAELNAVGPAGARAATGLQSATKWAGRAAVAFVGLEVAGAVFDSMGNSAVNVNKLTAALQEYATTGKMTQGLTDIFGQDLESLGKNAKYASDATHGFTGMLADLSSYVPGLDTLSEWTFGTSFSDSTEKMKALDESFSAFIATQKDAKKASELWNEILTKSGLDTEQLAELLPGAWKGMQDLQAAAHSGAGAQGELSEQTAATTAQMEKQKEQAEELKKAFDDLFGRYMSADEAAMEYEKSLVSTNKELASGAKTLDVHSEAGQKNRTATLDLIKAVKEQRDANINNGMAVDEADKKYRSQITTLGKTMLHLGYTKTEVEKLIGKYRAIPSRVGTSIETPGLPKASGSIKDYKGQLDSLARQIKTHVSVEGDAAAYRKLEKLLIAQRVAMNPELSLSGAASAFRKQEAKAFHEGGWTGPGGKYEPAGVVHADEFVVNKAARRKIEATNPGLLDEMNATGQVRGYAGGGLVMPFPVDASRTKIPAMMPTASFGDWPSSPGAQRGDSGIWRKIVAMVRASGIPYDFGNGYRPGDPLWHGSGRAVDFMGYNQDRLAQFFQARQGSVLELIHRTKSRDYGITRGHYNAMPHQWPLHKNHLHVAMEHGGTIREPVYGVGVSGNTYSFGENWKPERVTPGAWSSSSAGGGGGTINVTVQAGYVVSERDLENKITQTIDTLRAKGRV
jgi:TP901 family phage tail tape measure protein